MDKAGIIPKIYGYLVCLAAVIVFLISVAQIVNASFALSDPIHTRDYMYATPMYDLSSFDAYKADYARQTSYSVLDATKTTATTTALTDEQLTAAYNSARDNQISSVRLQATRTITSYIILLIVAGLLFWSHWRWLHKEK